MVMKQLLLPLVIVCFCVFNPYSHGQTPENIRIIEGKIVQFLSGTSFEFAPETEGTIQSGITVELPPDKRYLMRNIKSFQHQKWRISIMREGEKSIVKSIYGLGHETEDQADPVPPPLYIESTEKTFPQHTPHSRSLIEDMQNEIVRLTNIERWNNGMRPPLKDNGLLDDAAQGHSEEMAFDDFFAHCNIDENTTPGQRVTSEGYNWNAVAENIAAGSSTPQGSMNQWMGSQGHRNNILSTSYRALGVGYAYDPSSSPRDRYDENGNCSSNYLIGPFGYYWTQNFGRRNNVYPVIINREEPETDSRTVNLYVYGTPISQYENFVATSMRFSNNGNNWSSWEPYNPDKTWQLSAGNGVKTVHAQIRNSSGSIKTATDQIILDGDECESIMTFSNETISGTQTYTDCEIIADPNVTIQGNITFEATTVTLGEGVEITPGTIFQIMMTN